MSSSTRWRLPYSSVGDEVVQGHPGALRRFVAEASWIRVDDRELLQVEFGLFAAAGVGVDISPGSLGARHVLVAPSEARGMYLEFREDPQR